MISQIIDHLVARHFGPYAKAAEIVTGPVGIVPNLSDKGRRLWTTFEAFRTHLCQLSSLPLSIKDVHPADVAFSYSDVAPLVAPPTEDGTHRTLHEAVLEFESSGRWPSDPHAAQRVCTALLLQIREELEGDLGISASVSELFLDVRYPEFTFRLRIFHPHEHEATAHRVTNFSAPVGGPPVDEDRVDRLRKLWWRPRIRTAMHAQVLRRPALAGCVRLVAQWMASQLLSGFDEFAEHLAAAAFTSPTPFEEPTSAQVGFCRVLWLLTNYPWAMEPFVVDFDDQLTEEERLRIRTSFEERHKDAPSTHTLWVASKFDPHGLLLCRPPATVSAWLVGRARAALAFFHQRLLMRGTPGDVSWQPLFALDSSLFDVIVRFGGAQDASKLGPKALRREAAARNAVTDLVVRLSKALAPIALVFHSTESRLVALKWRPGAFLPQGHSVAMGAVPHTLLAQDTPEKAPLCVPNVLCLTSLVASLAGTLAVEVEVLGAR